MKKYPSVLHLVKGSFGGAFHYAQRLNDQLNQAGQKSEIWHLIGHDTPNARRVEQTISPLNRAMNGIVRRAMNVAAETPFSSTIHFSKTRGLEQIRNFDVLHIHSLNGVLSLSSVDRKIASDQKVFWTIHNLWPLSGGCIVEVGLNCMEYPNGCSACPLKPSYFHWMIRREFNQKIEFLRRRKVVLVANSVWTLERLIPFCRRHGLAPPQRAFPLLEPAFMQRTYNDRRPTGRPTLMLAAASLTDPRKGIVQFLNALAGRQDLPDDLRVIVCGEGQLPDYPKLDVHRHRYQDTQSLIERYRESDVFVSSSLAETFGMSVLEATVCGCSIAGFDVGAVREATHPRFHNTLVEPGDFDRLCDVALAQLASLPHHTEYDLQTWAENFSPARVMEQNRAIYLGDNRYSET